MTELLTELARNGGFEIAFGGESVPDLEPGEVAILGTISLGLHRESFVADLSFWSRGQYEMQWLQALQTILSREDRTALITSMHDPANAKFIEWWPMWKEGSEIILHNQLLLLDSLGEPFDSSHPGRFIGDRISTNEEGQAISEWRIQVYAVREFLKLLSQQSKHQ